MESSSGRANMSKFERELKRLECSMNFKGKGSDRSQSREGGGMPFFFL